MRSEPNLSARSDSSSSSSSYAKNDVFRKVSVGQDQAKKKKKYKVSNFSSYVSPIYIDRCVHLLYSFLPLVKLSIIFFFQVYNKSSSGNYAFL